MKDANTMANNWKTAMANPQTASKYTQGINSTTVNPMALAASAQSQQLYAQNTAAAVSSGRMAAKLNAVPLEMWKANATGEGARRLSGGATKAAAKVAAHFQKWAPIYQQASAAAKALPKGGYANAMARVGVVVQTLMAAAGKA